MSMRPLGVGGGAENSVGQALRPTIVVLSNMMFPT